MSIRLTRIAPGEYTYKDYSISKDENESNLWWLSKEGNMVPEDYYSLDAIRKALSKIDDK